MAHLLEMLANGQAAFAFQGQPAWHGLGIDMTDSPNPTFASFLAAAQCDWEVEKAQMQTTDGHTIPNLSALRRATDKKFYSVVGSDWEPIQNREVADFLDTFVAAGHLTPETFGSMKEGAEIFAAARMPDGQFDLPGGDTVLPYILFHSPHMYGKAATLTPTTVRPVCNNTVTAALRQDGRRGMRLPHMREFAGDVRKAAETMVAEAAGVQAKFKEAAEYLSTLRINRELAENLIAQVYQPTLLTPDRLADPSPLRADFGELAANVLVAMETSPGATMLSAKGTGWGLLNAVTYVEDHLSLARSPEAVMAASQFGRGAERKNKMMDLLLAA